MKENSLRKRKNCWYINCKVPKRFGGGLLQYSLKTSDIKEARNIRDKYVRPVFTQDSAINVLEAIARMVSSLDSQTRDQVNALKNKILKNNSDNTVGELSGKYIIYLKKSSLREASIQNYSSALSSFNKILGKERTFQSLSRKDIVDVRNKLLEEISARRLQFIFQSYRTFIRWCIQESYISDCMLDYFNITLPLSRSVHTSTIPPAKAGDCMSCMKGWTLAPRIARYTGMRREEILRLEKSDISDFHGIKCINVDDRSKTHEKRIVPIADKLLPYMNDLSELRLSLKKAPEHYNIKIKGIPGCEKCKFHSWRVYANTSMMEAGVDQAVRMKILGHRASKSEVHIGYTSVQISQMKKAVDLIP